VPAEPQPRRDVSYHLIFDCDDTLWENNIYFERSIEEFIGGLSHTSLSREAIRAVFDEIERANALEHGYGSLVFSRSLRDCYTRLANGAVDEAELARVEALGRRILDQEIELIPHVESTLAQLARRHTLTMFTKGHPEEQRLKVQRSGLEQYVHQVEIVPEKNVAGYLTLLDRLGVEPERAWMIGNSPKSDINPALAVGMNAVFIPHDHTWRLEHQELATGPGTLLRLERFADLIHHF
jgi:putative hydrolase of the HAD superfamily